MECCQVCGNLKEVWDYYDRIVPCPECSEKTKAQKSNDQEDLMSLRIKEASDGT